MHAKIRTVALAALVSLAAAGAAPAQTVTEWSLHYLARHSYAGPDGDMLDNDHVRLNFGIGHDLGAVTLYGALGLGVRNEYFEEAHAHAGLEAGLYRVADWGRHGAVVRGLWTDGFGDAASVGYGLEYWTDTVTLRGLVEAQSVDGPTRAGTEGELFALAEASWYAADWLALRGGVMVQSEVPFARIGAEVLPGRASPVSVYADWSVALDDRYRGFPADYNDLAMGLRLTFGGGSLAARDRARPSALFYRPIDPF